MLIAELSVLHLYYRLPETTRLKSLLCYSCALTVRDMVSDDVFDPFMNYDDRYSSLGIKKIFKFVLFKDLDGR